MLELLIYIAVLSGLVLVVGKTFISLNSGNSQSESQSEVNSNMRFALQKITQDMHDATSVTLPATANATSSSLSMVVSGSTVTYCVVSGLLMREPSGSCTGSSPQVTGSKVNISSITFTRLENTNSVLSKTVVSVSTLINMSYNSTSPNRQFSQSKQATIYLRDK